MTYASSPTSSARLARRSAAPRRGVILLMMVIILVLFSLVCVTWVISARQFGEITSASASRERYDATFEDLLDEAFMQVIRGSLNQYSAIGPHSLLEDKYGNDFYDSWRQPAAPQLISANFVPNSGNALTELVFQEGGSPANLSRLDDYYNGRLLTFYDAGNEPNVAGRTVRIVDFVTGNAGGTSVWTFIVESFPNGGLPAAPNQNPAILINGREFNGSGFVFNLGGAFPFAPNPASIDVNVSNPNPAMPASIFDFAGGYNIQGADESYDLPDWNNMILAGRVWDQAQGRWRVLLPSMHRPAFLNYVAQLGATPQDMRNFLFRPSTDGMNGNPDFVANNQQLSSALTALFSGGGGLSGALLANPNLIAYDVDNDGDGEADSIWIDLGFPVQTAADGRMYKPLFAILVEDLDSRLNVNHHGTQELAIEQTNTENTYTQTHSVAAGSPAAVPGLGEGPADVSIQTFLLTFQNNAGEGAASYGRLLYGDGVFNEGRYGELHRAGFADYNLPAPGVNNVHDSYSAIFNHDFRNWRRRFGLPMDLRANDRVGVGVDGNLLHASIGYPGMLNLPQLDNPYEFNSALTRKLFSGTGVMYEDRPFTAAELEPILRYPDADVTHSVNLGLGTVSQPIGLEERLMKLLQLSLDTTTSNGQRVAGQITTHSADSPAPNIAYTPDMLLAAAADPTNLQPLIDAAPSPSIVDLVRFRIAQANPTLADVTGPMYPTPLNQVTNATINNYFTGYFLSPDLLDGTRMDLNRPFGNGRDDLDLTNNSGNGVVDEGHNAYMGPAVGAPANMLSPYYDPMVIGAAARPDLVGECVLSNVTQPVWELLAEDNDLAGAVLITELTKYTPFYNNAQPYPNYSVQMVDLNYNGRPYSAAPATFDKREHLARHDYSRHLFTLLMLLKSQDPAMQFQFSASGAIGPAGDQEVDPEFTVYRLAQFAANAADYLDRDSIMSAFEYDAQPFVDNDNDPTNGTWDVDGDITTDESTLLVNGNSRRVIWGMERPTMVLDETWAFHDVRTRDTDDETGGEYTPQSPSAGGGDMDTDFDQTRMPQGSLFFELYCAVNGVVPAELRPESISPWNQGRVPENVVDLSRLAPPGMDDPITAENEAYRRPVWRMTVAPRNDNISSLGDLGATPYNNPLDLYRPSINPALPSPLGMSLQTLQSPDPTQVSRVVWFTSWDAYMQQAGVTPETVEPRVYYSDLQRANFAAPDDQKDFGNLVDWGFDDLDTREAAMRMFHVAPSQYAVVGPRVTTKIGHSFPEAFSGVMPPVYEDKPNETVIQLMDPALAADATGAAVGLPYGFRPVAPVSDGATPGTGLFRDLSVLLGGPDQASSYKSPDWTNTNNQNPPAAQETQRVVRRPVGIVINGPRVTGGVGRRVGRGLSISEPDPTQPYYPQPDDVTGATPPAPITIDNFDGYETPDDEPYDVNGDVPVVRNKAAQPAGGGPYAIEYEDDDGPKSLFLQRLANPLAPYHAVYNPYITVDVMDLDLSVYNGEEPLDHPDQQDNPPELLVSRQKTGQLFNPTSNTLSQERSIWGYVSSTAYLNNPAPLANHSALHSLGHANGLYNGGVAAAVPDNDHFFLAPGALITTEAGSAASRLSYGGGLAEYVANMLVAENYPIPTAGVLSDRANDLQLAPEYANTLLLALEQTMSNFSEIQSLGYTYPNAETGPGGIFLGSALNATAGTNPPSLAWNDRPFVSPFELLLVPATSADRFSRDFGIRSANAGFDPYDTNQMNNQASFRYLLDFFQPADANGALSNFYQLFEYVNVPSKFPESQEILNPTNFANMPALPGPTPYAHTPLYPPFNKISKFREPGKINLNGGFDTGDVFAAALNDRIDPVAFEYVYNGALGHVNIRDTRKGYGAGVVALPGVPNPVADFELDPNVASFFQNPFRGFSAPTIGQTLLRPDRNPGGGGSQPILAARTNTDGGNTRLGTNPFVGSGSVPIERDGDRNAFMRYEPLNKLGNIATTRSNVYAVWITVGFFEVKPAPGGNPPRDWYPDGFALGRELGLEENAKIRHRMFGIIDRTRPCAFNRGYDMNARDTILMQRVIE